jgi:hypothetical protein
MAESRPEKMLLKDYFDQLRQEDEAYMSGVDETTLTTDERLLLAELRRIREQAEAYARDYPDAKVVQESTEPTDDEIKALLDELRSAAQPGISPPSLHRGVPNANLLSTRRSATPARQGLRAWLAALIENVFGTGRKSQLEEARVMWRAAARRPAQRGEVNREATSRFGQAIVSLEFPKAMSVYLEYARAVLSQAVIRLIFPTPQPLGGGSFVGGVAHSDSAKALNFAILVMTRIADESGEEPISIIEAGRRLVSQPEALNQLEQQARDIGIDERTAHKFIQATVNILSQSDTD